MVYFLELMISFESTIDHDHYQNLAKYNDLLVAARMAGYNTEYHTFEFRSRCLVIENKAS